MPGFAARTDEFTESNIFTILEYKRQVRAARGLPVYNLSVGTPDFPPAPHIIEATKAAAADPEMYKYALVDSPELVGAVQRWYARRYGAALEPREIMSVAGSQEGLAHIGLTLLNPGETILAPNPGYPIFDIGPRLMGGRTAFYPLRADNGFLPDLREIGRTMPDGVRAMVVSYPMNPLCAVAPRSFYKDLVEFANRHGVWIIHDNAYSEITYDGYVGGSFLSVDGAKDIGVEFNSLSKTYNLTGTRVSFLMGNAELLRRFSAMRSEFDYGLCRIFQRSAIAALDGPQDHVVSQRARYEARRDALCGGMRRIGWDIPDSKGTMFVWARIPRGYNDDDSAFVADLFDRSGVITIPGSVFGALGRGHVRLALTMPVPGIEEAVAAVAQSGILDQ
ncbi:MAG: aminotransferase class I/II-fold pyridoxal phosphate-dependent enzyme [Oscillospiraceae bacterium]|jgi:LL-diaminopimelate aminotransferase|nr:aminotransferase class I/II-fold pyridoxal phosphate-dependent enzyme [Oscillospiraceae bacterium]